ncbi:MAG: DUF1566 domain-containing protein [Terriglobales bacterium]
MRSLRADLNELVARHVSRHPTARVLTLIEQLCDVESPGETQDLHRADIERFTKISTECERLPSSATDWAAVHDSRTNLVWTRQVLDCGEVGHAEAMKAASAVRLFRDCAAWRAPTIEEQLSIIDYGRSEPALDTRYFDGKFGWTWTSTPAKALSGCAWGVGLDGGGSGRLRQDAGGFVRAVCAGQQLAFGL